MKTPKLIFTNFDFEVSSDVIVRFMLSDMNEAIEPFCSKWNIV